MDELRLDRLAKFASFWHQPGLNRPMYTTFRSLLFRLPPERAHSLTLSMLKLAGALPPTRAFLRALFEGPDHPVKAFGLSFRNPIGLAAGYDKDGQFWRGLACLGFGHLEIGTVTPQPQAGNPTPRLFRLPGERALINRMGFPSRGANFVGRCLQSSLPAGLVLGVNIGKNKDTPLEAAVEDYRAGVRAFAPLADYLTVNVSSPNTVGLRQLQASQALHSLLTTVAEERRTQAELRGQPLPVLVKLAPDLNETELEEAVDVIADTGMDGVIATNTTVKRLGLPAHWQREAGGLSGRPLYARSLETVRFIARYTQGRLPIVGVGGIDNPDAAQAMLEAGASLVQIYTGLVYEGPALVKRILNHLA